VVLVVAEEAAMVVERPLNPATPVLLTQAVAEVVVNLNPLMAALVALESSSFVGLNHNQHPLPQQEALR
jgi:hypothetical protein